MGNILENSNMSSEALSRAQAQLFTARLERKQKTKVHDGAKVRARRGSKQRDSRTSSVNVRRRQSARSTEPFIGVRHSISMDPSRRLSLVPQRAALEQSISLDARTDDELMLLARGGLDAAFSSLIRRHQAKTLRLAVRYLGRESVAADVAQDTFVEVFRALPQYQAKGKFSSYLYRVLLNRCHMTWRSTHAEQRALQFAALAVSDVDEVEILLREWRRDVSFALGALSEKLRSVVLLRYCAGLSYDEIAAALEVPEGTVKRRLFDALTKLRTTLGDR